MKLPRRLEVCDIGYDPEIPEKTPASGSLMSSTSDIGFQL